MEIKQRRERIRRKIKTLNEKKLPRMCIFKSEKNIYAQIIDSLSGKVLAQSSTLSKDFKSSGIKSYNKEGATFIGKNIGEQAKKNGIKEVVFDRSGYKFHGRIKALAEAAQEFIKI